MFMEYVILGEVLLIIFVLGIWAGVTLRDYVAQKQLKHDQKKFEIFRRKN